jgi:putative ABC transport system permease protein
MRVPPMAAVTAVATQTRPRRVWMAGGMGIVCLAMQATLWLCVPWREARFYLYVVLGIPLVFTGWCLLAPSILLLVESLGAQVLGRLFGVRPTLLRHAWSRTPWRAGAMIAALMIGVTLFTAVRARGASLLASWTSPAKIPDLIVKSFSGGLDEQRIGRLRKEHPEFREIGLFDFFSVRLNTSVFQLGSLLGEGDTNFIAVDPVVFSRMVEMDYVQGDRETAMKQLAEGRHILVSKEFYNVRKLGVGDKLVFRGADGKPVEFTIAGVVASTGVELVKNYFDLRTTFAERAISSVLGTIDDGQKYFKLGTPTLMLANVSTDTMEDGAMVKFQEKLTWEGMQSVSSVELKTALRKIIEQIMNGLSVVGVGALCVASLGVANMVIASIHARRFEFGVLRAIGAGRSQLVRLVLAEVTLVGGVAGILGAGAGLHFAFMATRVDFLLIGFPTNFLATDFPHVLLNIAELMSLAIGLTTLLAWLASLAPAVRGSLQAQRTLLASGRA